MTLTGTAVVNREGQLTVGEGGYECREDYGNGRELCWATERLEERGAEFIAAGRESERWGQASFYLLLFVSVRKKEKLSAKDGRGERRC